jgi:HEAT repeat protein
MIYEKGKLSIRDVLKHRDAHLWDKLEEIWNMVYKELDMDSTNFVLTHSLSVEQNISSLIPDKWKSEKLHPLELFALSATACLHDIDKYWETAKNLHGEISAGEIRSHFVKYGLDAGQADIVGWITKVHDHGDFGFDLPEDPIVIGVTNINIRILAALFKFADVLHADYHRVDKEMPVNPKDRARYCIRGWKYDVDGRIKFCANPEQISDLEHIHRAIAMMRQDIEKIALILREVGYPYEIAVPEIDESKLIYATQTKKLSERSFLGMDSFSEDDQHLFKGRKNESQELYQMLLVNDPIVALVGDSGIGKTSLIKAGLFPILRKVGWKFAYIKIVHNDIFDSIQRMWFQIMEDDLPCNLSFTQSLKAISEYNHHLNNLIIFDQFEDALGFSQVLEQIRDALYHVQAMRFRNVRVLLCYRSDFEGQVGPILQDIAYSMRSIPRLYLRTLDINGARDALVAGMDAAHIGFDPDVGYEKFLEIILRDIERQDRGFYPPYIQMVGETLRDRALNEQHSIIQKTSYDSLNGVTNIIGDYQFKQLESFGEERKDAENILIELTNTFGNELPRSRARSIEDLTIELGIETDELKGILHEMICKWIIRHLGSGGYELIHEDLAKQVNEKLITARKGLDFKKLRENLCAVATIYSNMNLILDPSVMSKIYLDRERIKPNFDEKLILLHSCIAQQGPAWFWFKDSKSDEYLPILYAGLSHPSISMDVIKLLGFTGDEKVVEKLIELIKDSDAVTCTAIEALGRIGSRKAIPSLIIELDSPNAFVRVASVKALSRLDAREAIPKMMVMIKGKELNIQKIALIAYSKLATQEDIQQFKEFSTSDILHEKLTAIKVLARLLGEQFMPELYKMLKDKDKHIRIAVVESMTDIAENSEKTNLFGKSPSFIAVVKSSLYPMLQDRSRDVRIIICKALTQLSSYEDISKLRSMLESDVIDIKIASAEALAKLVCSEGSSTLKEIFRDNGRKGQMALDALIRLEDRTIIPELTEMVRNENPIFQKLAVRGLGALGTEADIPLLLDMIISVTDGYLYANDALIYIDRRLYCPFNWGED